MSFVGYHKNTLFQSQILEEEENKTIDVLGPIISAVVLGKEVKNLEEPIVLKIVPTKVRYALTGWGKIRRNRKKEIQQASSNSGRSATCT